MSDDHETEAPDATLAGRHFLTRDRNRWGCVIAEAGRGIYLVEQRDPDSTQILIDASEMHEQGWRFFDTEDSMEGGRNEWCGGCGGDRWAPELDEEVIDGYRYRSARQIEGWDRAREDVRYRTHDGTPTGRPCRTCHIHDGVVTRSNRCRICVAAAAKPTAVEDGAPV